MDLSIGVQPDHIELLVLLTNRRWTPSALVRTYSDSFLVRLVTAGDELESCQPCWQSWGHYHCIGPAVERIELGIAAAPFQLSEAVSGPWLLFAITIAGLLCLVLGGNAKGCRAEFM